MRRPAFQVNEYCLAQVLVVRRRRLVRVLRVVARRALTVERRFEMRRALLLRPVRRVSLSAP